MSQEVKIDDKFLNMLSKLSYKVHGGDEGKNLKDVINEIDSSFLKNK